MDLAAVLLSRWRTVLGTLVGTVVIAALIVPLLPDTYVARTVIVPAPSKGGARAQLLAGQMLPVGVADLVGGSQERSEALIQVILKSRSLPDSIVGHVAGGALGEEEVQEILAKRTDIETGPEGEITIEVAAHDPRVAARIASEFPEVINTLAASVTREAALRRQRFLEDQLAVAREMLLTSEQEALEFQQRSDVPEVQEQARQTVEAAARLQEQIMQQEVRVSQLARTATPSNPELRAARAELEALRVQLRRLTSGAGGADRVFLSLRESPELKLSAARLLREFAKNEHVYSALLASLTEAQLDVQSNLPVVSVVDPAVVPEEPSGPNAPIILSLAAILGLVVGVAAAFMSEWLRRLPADPGNESFLTAWDQVKRDFSHYTPRFRNGRARAARKEASTLP